MIGRIVSEDKKSMADHWINPQPRDNGTTTGGKFDSRLSSPRQLSQEMSELRATRLGAGHSTKKTSSPRKSDFRDRSDCYSSEEVKRCEGVHDSVVKKVGEKPRDMERSVEQDAPRR
ncbi:hypothetical protein BaRGS_00016290 [Batillaria attramentaria]|uniref:Uncharacterized protein n=1 Tax=Batillaria attramentaria TaxID=370345 RepID=A0ABD0L074_9CAEN